MKTTKLFSILLLFLLTQSCVKEEYDKVEHKTNYYYLTAAQLNQTPYFTNPAFDTISFTSDKGDTLTFVKTKTDTTWYCEQGSGNPNTGYDKDCYQTIHNTYITTKGNGSFDVKHSKKNILQNTDVVVFSFGPFVYYTFDFAINNVNHPRYLGTITLNSKTFNNVMYSNHNFSDSLSSVCYINKTEGIFYIEDKIEDEKYLYEK
ncbi:MAG: hypothetical protein JHD28_05825 [Bacteroidia bacterium]|nr:hypothetical protein [Bacteroidia bacterium]